MARPWSPSLVLIERTSARCSIWPASLGRCSLIRRPGTAVSIALTGPPFSWPGLRSKVSIWLGPPFIQSRMHARRRLGWAAASAARVSIQPEVDRGGDAGRGQAEPVAAGVRSVLRTSGVTRHRSGSSAIRQWFKTNSALLRSDQKTSARAFLGSRVGPAALDVGDRPVELLGRGRRVRAGQVEGLDLAGRVEEVGVGDRRQGRPPGQVGRVDREPAVHQGQRLDGSTSGARSGGRPGPANASRKSFRGESLPKTKSDLCLAAEPGRLDEAGVELPGRHPPDRHPGEEPRVVLARRVPGAASDW